MNSPFLVPVSYLLKSVPSRRDIDLRAPFDERHEFTPRAVVDADVPLDADVELHVQLESFRGGINVRGTIKAPWHGLCRRCSTAILGEIEVAVSERFVEHLSPEDEEAYPIEHDFLDLLPMVHDAVLLELPIAPLCRADCQGLCPTCGVDRNDVTCSCASERHEHWATLDALRFEDDASSD